MQGSVCTFGGNKLNHNINSILNAIINTYKVFVSVGVLVKEAELFMDEVLHNARPDLGEGDAGGDEDDAEGGHRAPDDRTALHADQDCGLVDWWTGEQDCG